jgi:hypothetical protein
MRSGTARHRRWLTTCAVLLVAHWAVGAQAPMVPRPDAAGLADVESAFARISMVGEHLTARVDGHIPKGAYRQSLTNLFGLHNHFQGIQRVPETDFVVVSGSNPQMSELFIVRLAAGDRVSEHAIPPENGIVARIAIDPVMWHAGGLSLEGTILAVPLYGGSPRRGSIAFYDLRDPEKPEKLAVEIDRLGRKSMAVALTRLPGGLYLAAVLGGYDGLPRRIEFYLSETERLEDGFRAPSVTLRVSEVQARPGQDRTFSHFQNANFIRQADSRLYLVGFHNKFFFQSRIFGTDHADLYEVVFPRDTIDAPVPRLVPPALIKAGSRTLSCTDGFCNLDAAAGLYVDPISQSMSVYAAPGWLAGDRMKFTVYGGK